MRDRIKTYVGVLRDNTAIVASVALFFLWLGITFQVPDFAVDGTFEPGLVAPWIVVAFCYALGYLVAVLWYRKIASLFLRRRFLVLVCLVMAAGVTIDIASSWNTDFFGSVSRVAYVGSILMCLGTTLIEVMTASIVAQIGARNTLLVSVAGMLVAATLMVALGFMGVWGKDIARLFVPLAMIPVNLLVFKGMPLRQVFMRGLNKNTAWPHKLLATSALHGAVFGFYIVAYSALGVEGSHIAFNGVCYGIAAVVLGVMMVAAQTDFNHLIYHRAFPAMAFGMLLICVCAEASVLGVGIVAAGYAFLHLIMCGVCSYLSKQFDLPAPWVISLTTLFFVGGQVIGAGATTLSLWLEAPIGDVAACAIFVLLIGSLGLSGIRNVRFGWGVVRPSTDTSTATPQEFAVQYLALDAGLTSREMEIALCLAEGKKRKQIADELCVSDQTVKTHVSHIYTKLGIHSKEELIELVRERASSFEE